MTTEHSVSEPTGVSARTLRRLEQASGGLATTSVAVMAERFSWFKRLSADQRAGVLLVTQTGVSNFVAWLGEPTQTIRLTAEGFRNAPRDLARRVSLRQTVEMVRVAIEVFEHRLPLLAVDDRERQLLTEAILRFGREIAFAAATVYASAAESRGAWDARLEALVVDGVVRGEVDDALVSRSSALGWDAKRPVTVLVGSPPPENKPESQPEPLAAMRRTATRLGRSVLLGVQGARLVVLLSGALSEPGPDKPATKAATSATSATAAAKDAANGRARRGPAERMAEAFGPGPVVIGPTAPTLAAAHLSARDALQGLRAVAGWPDAPRPVRSGDLLPERALAGDPSARAELISDVCEPLASAGGELRRTLAAYLDGGGALESCARALFVHANTVRYRLRRVSEVTGLDPTRPRDALVLRIALIVGRLNAEEEQRHSG
ncbi:PucR family transcriptional regulator [Pseudonocardia acaciae]|uniref:PucR family transcriptional regulator n=1 Tax=Pseudonocardia acaciae TaxID=551276 RepID=UPI00048D029E|nr:PucR family transcriptional regulator [Pseudonocardia acaciae]